MVLFYAIMYLPMQLVIGSELGVFSSISVEWRIAFVVLSCFSLMIFFWVTPDRLQKVGVTYVVERLNYHHGNLPIWNAIVQFFAAAISLAGGLSVGKEGPAVHLGATVGSYFAEKMKLPQYGVETLIACGVAGAISAIFQTPLAGVLFAFEVIFLEYQQRYALPVLMSSVVATLVSHYIIGPLELFSIDSITSFAMSVDFFVACAALAVAVVLFSALFLHTQKCLWRFNNLSVWFRFSLVAVITSMAALYFPEILGSDYYVLNSILSGELIVYSLLLLVVVKTLLTAITVGLGVPGGMIGPTFIIGGLLGAQIALMFDYALTDVTLFVLLGMAAMMAACFQAPLTALVAIVEMTHSSEVIVPALFVVVFSCLFMKVFFHQESIFVERLSYMGMISTINPLQRYLRHHTIQPVAESVVLLSSYPTLEQVKNLASNMLEYVVFEREGRYHFIRQSALFDKLHTLNFGPQPWLMIVNDDLSMDLTQVEPSNFIQTIESPSSLEAILVWFQKTKESEVLVSTSDGTFSLVSRHRLDQFLLQDD